MRDLTFASLRKWNIGVGCFQAVTGIVLLAINDYGLTTPWYSFFILERDAGFKDTYVPNPKEHVDFPIGVLSGVFLLLSAADHLITALPGFNKAYNRGLCGNINKYRWIEYSVSAALMRVQIAQLSGVVGIHLLFAIFGLTATTMLFGWLMESMNGHRLRTYYAENGLSSTKDQFYQSNGSEVNEPISAISNQPVDWTPFIMGFIPHAFAWSIVGCFFFQSVSNGDPPTFVWAIIFILFFLDLLFAVNQWAHFKQFKFWQGFGRAEFVYIILSLTAKQLLAWIEYGGTQSLDE